MTAFNQKLLRGGAMGNAVDLRLIVFLVLFSIRTFCRTEKFKALRPVNLEKAVQCIVDGQEQKNIY
jgi:hypothetical protein